MNNDPAKEPGFDWSEFRMGVMTTLIVIFVIKILIEVVNP